MNEDQRGALRGRLEEMINTAGPDGIGFRALYARISRELVVTRRNALDELARLETEGVIRSGGVSQNVRTYVHMSYRQARSQNELDRAAIYGFREMTKLFPGPKPGRFYVR